MDSLGQISREASEAPGRECWGRPYESGLGPCPGGGSGRGQAPPRSPPRGAGLSSALGAGTVRAPLHLAAFARLSGPGRGERPGKPIRDSKSAGVAHPARVSGPVKPQSLWLQITRPSTPLCPRGLSPLSLFLPRLRLHKGARPGFAALGLSRLGGPRVGRLGAGRPQAGIVGTGGAKSRGRSPL